MDGFKMPSLSARNPLGIIALFISLIYGMSAMLLGATVEHLSAGSQSVLVWFVALFPVLVLAAFSWLVGWHHKKLYGPGDFRSDESFLATETDPRIIGQRLIAEASISAIDLIEESGGVPAPTPTTAHSGVAEDSSPVENPTTPSLEDAIRQDPVAIAPEHSVVPIPLARVFLAEGLAFQELQRKYNGFVRRDVEVAGKKLTVRLDGLVLTPDNRKIYVAIIYARGQRQLNRGGERALNEYRALAWDASLADKFEIVVIDDAKSNLDFSELYGNSEFSSTQCVLTIMKLAKLLQKYGLGPAGGALLEGEV